MLLLPLLLVATSLDLRLELVRESLTGTHYRYRQYIDDLPVVGGEVNVTVRGDGKREEVRTVAARSEVASPGQSYVNVDGTARPARQEVVDGVLRYLDVRTGTVILEQPLVSYAKPARVFDPNPVVKLNDPSLSDQNDSATAVPDAAYSVVELNEVAELGPLSGPYVRIADFQPPFVAPADAAGPLLFDRSESGFEDVNAYFHIDRSQRHLQSLGYTGPRGIAPYAVEVDTHGVNGQDISFYVPGSVAGRGMLVFGEGGTDDAEDSDLVVHEYAHVLHEWISPGTFLGPYSSQGRALSEGFGDYWAFSAEYENALASGRDPFCFADWDARCGGDFSSERCAYPAGADCLRRLDGVKTMADFLTIDTAGTEHRNGEIWSSALRQIFLDLTAKHGVRQGRKITDKIVLESLFGAPPNPSFAGIARNMIVADRYLSGGTNGDTICAAMRQRGIVDDCAPLPRGELTYFQTPQRSMSIPDNTPAGITLSTFVSDARLIERVLVSVEIEHPFRGDLRIVLTAPDGTELVLQNTSLDRAADVHATYGRDALPAQPLDSLRGRSAAGQWRLTVSDFRSGDAGRVLTWSLVIRFQGDEPLAARPTGPSRQIIPVAGRTPGARGTFFITDIQLANRGARDEIATLIFTPSGRDGRIDFGAVKVSIPPGQVVAFDDIVGRLFGTVAIGQLEIAGDVLASARVYTRSAVGTYGQGIMARRPAEAVGLSAPLAFVSQLQSTAEFRSNVGFAEVGGSGGTIRMRLYDATSGEVLSTAAIPITPFGHLQMPVHGAARLLAEIGVTEGEARVLGYGAIIDNRSGDGITVPAARPESGIGVGPAISAAGAVGTRWRTDLWLTRDPHGPPAGSSVTLTYHPSAAPSKTLNVSLPQVSLELTDIVAAHFDSPSTRGVIEVELPDGVMIGTRTWTSGGDATYGQFIPLAMPVDSDGDLLPIESSLQFRTNIGLIADTRSVVRVVLFDAGGREISQSEHVLEPFSLQQFPVRDDVVDGRARVEVISGRVYAYASVVDNRSGDPTFLPMQ